MISYSETNTKTDSKLDFLTKWVQTGYQESVKIARNISDDELREKLKEAVKLYKIVVNDNIQNLFDAQNNIDDTIEDFLLTNEFFFSENVDNVFEYVFTPAWDPKTNEFTVIDIDDVNNSIIAIDDKDEEYIDKYDCQNLYTVIEPIMKGVVNTIVKNTNDKDVDFIFNIDKLVGAITAKELDECRWSFIDYINKVRESLIKYLSDTNISEMSKTAESGEF